MKKCVFFVGALFVVSLFYFSTSNAATCPLTVGKVYKVDGSPSVYYVSEGCKKRPIRSGDVFFSYFTSWTDVVTTTIEKLKSVPDHELGFLPWGPKREYQNGSLLKTTDDGKVYLYVNGELKPIADAAAFSAQGLKWEWIEDVSPEVIGKFKKVNELNKDSELPKSTVFKYKDSPEVYILEEKNGQKVKRHIKGIEELRKLYRIDRILEISKERKLSDTLVLDSEDGTEKKIEARPLVSPQSLAKDIKRVSDVKSLQEALRLFHADHTYYPEGRGIFGGLLMTSLCEDGFSDLCRSEIVYMKEFPKDPGSYSYEFMNFTGKSYTITFEIDSPVGHLHAGTIIATPEGMKTLKEKERMATDASSTSADSTNYVSCAPDVKTGDANIELCKGYVFRHIPSNTDISVRGFDQNKLELHILKHKSDGKAVDFDWTLYKGEQKDLNFFENAGTTFQLKYKGQELMVKGRGIIPLLNIRTVVKQKNVSTDADTMGGDSHTGVPSINNTKLPCTVANSYGAFGEDMDISLCPGKSWHQLQGKFAVEYVALDKSLQTLKTRIYGIDGDDATAGRLVNLKFGEASSFMIGTLDGKPYKVTLLYAGDSFYLDEVFLRMSVIPQDSTKRCYSTHEYLELGEEDTLVDICTGQIFRMLHGNFRMKLLSISPSGEVTLNVSRVKEYNWNDGQDLILQPGNKFAFTTTDSIRSEFGYKVSLVYNYENAQGNPVFALKAESL